MRELSAKSRTEFVMNLLPKFEAGLPLAVFFSEDGFEVARYGERTLARYRQLVGQLTGEGCATGLVKGDDPVQRAVVQDWLDEFERVQWVLRLSPRLRRMHGD